jgi:hypothetical protein
MEIRTPVLALKGPRANRYTMGACLFGRAAGFYHPHPHWSSNYLNLFLVHYHRQRIHLPAVEKDRRAFNVQLRSQDGRQRGIVKWNEIADAFQHNRGKVKTTAPLQCPFQFVNLGGDPDVLFGQALVAAARQRLWTHVLTAGQADSKKIGFNQNNGFNLADQLGWQVDARQFAPRRRRYTEPSSFPPPGNFG